MEKNDQTVRGGSSSKNIHESQHQNTSDMQQQQGSGSNSVAHNNNGSTVRQQDLLLPLDNVTKLMRKIIPTAEITDGAKEAIQECASEFIGVVTSEAIMRCQHDLRKTLTPEDVLWAMDSLGFDDYIEPLKLYLHRYRQSEAGVGAVSGPLRGAPFVRRPVHAGGLPLHPVFQPGYFIGPNARHPAAMGGPSAGGGGASASNSQEPANRKE